MQVLTDQLFNYRKSPALQDGAGRFDKIKGKTINWNQLVPNGNFVDTSGWNAPRGSLTVSNNVCTFLAESAPARMAPRLERIAGHKYYITCEQKYTTPSNNIYAMVIVDGDNVTYIDSVQNTNWNKYSIIYTEINNASGNDGVRFIQDGRGGGWDNIQIKNCMCIDLTQMGLDTLTVEQFEALFSLPYYDFCSGSLISLGGRNVKFNQLIINGNFDGTGNWSYYRCTISTSNNVATITSTGVDGNIYKPVSGAPKIIAGHKYYFSGEIKCGGSNSRIQFSAGNAQYLYDYTGTNWKRFSRVIAGSISTKDYIQYEVYAYGDGGVTQLRNAMCVDLTQMFGVGNEPSVQGFESLFPDPYYAYTLSKYMNLVSDVSLKTTGKNLCDISQKISGYLDGNGNINPSGASFVTGFIRVIPNSLIIFQWKYQTLVSENGRICEFYDGNKRIISNSAINPTYSYAYFTVPQNACYVRFTCDNGFTDVQLEYNSVPSAYEPYKTSTLSLPITDYFPDGEMSAGSVFDELTKTDYKKRIGIIDLGSLAWEYISSGPGFRANITNANVNVKNSVCSNYVFNPSANQTTASAIVSRLNDKEYAWYSNLQFVFIKDTSYTDAATFKSAMSGVYLQYELATSLQDYGVVDLGMLNYEYSSDLGTMSAYINDIKTPANDDIVVNAFTPCAMTIKANDRVSNISRRMYMFAGDKTMYFRGFNYTSASDFKNAMSGVYLLYEKANPQPLTPTDPDDYYIFDAWKDGTEQLLPENGIVPVTAPILADMSYSSGKVQVVTHPNPIPGGETSGDGWFLVGEEATINAVPNEHYIFKNWELDNEVVSTDPEYTFEVENE